VRVWWLREKLYFYRGFGGGETGQLFICPHLRQAAERYGS